MFRMKNRKETWEFFPVHSEISQLEYENCTSKSFVLPAPQCEIEIYVVDCTKVVVCFFCSQNSVKTSFLTEPRFQARQVPLQRTRTTTTRAF